MERRTGPDQEGRLPSGPADVARPPTPTPSRRAAARRLSPLIRSCLPAAGIAAVVGIGAFLLRNSPNDPVVTTISLAREVGASVPDGAKSVDEAMRKPITRRMQGAAQAGPASITASPPVAPATEATLAAPPAVPPPTPTPNAVAATPPPPPVGSRLSAEEMAALLARGDTLLSLGDVASARLFYERAADAGGGLAAVRLGETLDPVFLDRVHLRGVRGDLGTALSWYRRARELVATETEVLLKALEAR